MPRRTALSRSPLASSALALVATVLCACASTSPPVASTPPTEAPPPTEIEAAEPEATPPMAAESLALPSAEAVLEKAVAAGGGRARIDAIDSYYLETVTRVPEKNLSATNRLWWKNGSFYAETDMPGVGLARHWGNPQEIWAEDPIHGRRKLSGVEAHQTRWGNALVLPAQWDEYFESARTRARRQDESGRSLIDVVLTSKEGDEVTLSFDEETGLLREQRFMQVTPMAEMPLTIRYDEYQELDGIRSPTRSVVDLSVMEAIETIIKLQTGVDVDPAKFVPPEG